MPPWNAHTLRPNIRCVRVHICFASWFCVLLALAYSVIKALSPTLTTFALFCVLAFSTRGTHKTFFPNRTRNPGSDYVPPRWPERPTTSPHTYTTWCNCYFQWPQSYYFAFSRVYLWEPESLSLVLCRHVLGPMIQLERERERILYALNDDLDWSFLFVDDKNDNFFIKSIFFFWGFLSFAVIAE